jgi:hypothetical protein
VAGGVAAVGDVPLASAALGVDSPAGVGVVAGTAPGAAAPTGEVEMGAVVACALEPIAGGGIAATGGSLGSTARGAATVDCEKWLVTITAVAATIASTKIASSARSQRRR